MKNFSAPTVRLEARIKKAGDRIGKDGQLLLQPVFVTVFHGEAFHGKGFATGKIHAAPGEISHIKIKLAREPQGGGIVPAIRPA